MSTELSVETISEARLRFVSELNYSVLITVYLSYLANSIVSFKSVDLTYISVCKLFCSSHSFCTSIKVDIEAGTVVDFKKPCFKILINE